MDNEFLRRRDHTVKSLEEFLGYCEKREYTGSVAILKSMLEEAKAIYPKEQDDRPKAALRLVGLELPTELRQVQAVMMIFRYVLNEHPFSTLVPRQIGKTVTVSEATGIDVKYQIEFQGSHNNAELFLTTITVNPKWVIRVSTVIANKKFTSIQITSNFGKGYFGLKSVKQEFTLRAEGEREAMWAFVHEHISHVTSAIHKANV